MVILHNNSALGCRCLKLQPVDVAELLDHHSESDGKGKQIGYRAGIQHSHDSEKMREDQQQRKQKQNLSRQGQEGSLVSLSNRTEEGRRNRLHKVQPGKQEENAEIANSKIKVFFCSVSKQSKNFPWIELEQKEGCDGNNRTDCDCHAVGILYALILFRTVVETLNRLTSLG